MSEPESDNPPSNESGGRGQQSRESLPNRLLRGAAHLAAMLTIIGVVLRLTLQDSVSGPTTAFYYATPPALLIMGALYCLIFSIWQRQWKRGLAWAVLLSMLIPYWIQYDWRWKAVTGDVSQADTPADSLDVVFWNVARKQDLSTAVAYLREANADIIGLVEVVGAAARWREFFETELPEYDVTVMGHGMYLLARGPSGEVHAEDISRNSASRQLRVTMNDREIDVFVVDVDSTPWRSRQEPLDRLAELASAEPDVPTIVMGDFNTPGQSARFDSLRENFVELFDEVGEGYGPTWPLPLPVHRLDGMWSNDRFIPISCRHGISSASDHRPVHGTLRLKSDR